MEIEKEDTKKQKDGEKAANEQHDGEETAIKQNDEEGQIVSGSILDQDSGSLRKKHLLICWKVKPLKFLLSVEDLLGWEEEGLGIGSLEESGFLA